MAETFFAYGQAETDYLKSKDKRLAAVIDRLGHIERACQDDLFEAIVNTILGQQISTKAHENLWRRIKAENGRLTAQSVLAMGRDKLQSYGTTWRKVDYIMEFAAKVESGEFDLNAVAQMPDAEAIAALSSLKGVGVWTAEMMLLFCLQRPDIFSYDDLAIRRGVRMVYRHRVLTRPQFEKYRRRLSPCCSVASLYFWAVAGGAIPDLTDPAERKKQPIRMDGDERDRQIRICGGIYVGFIRCIICRFCSTYINSCKNRH